MVPGQQTIFGGSLTPLKNYPGKKAAGGQWQRILSEIPACDLFIEVMCGSAHISSLVNGCNRVINDLNTAIIKKISYNSADVEFRNEDYAAIIKRFDNGNARRVFYFDPPYLVETRSFKKSIYKHDWQARDHARFIAAVSKMKCPAMISHYPCKLYDKAFKSWRKISYNAMTRAGIREENLYLNFPAPVLLQCSNHVGENFTDRQRIKRKVQRLIERLQTEPAKERAAILTAVIEQFQYVAKQ